MSNLRSDAREYAAKLPLGNDRTYIERLCYQVDSVEECWHAAERRANSAEKRLRLWEWLADMRCNVHRNSVIGQPDWYVIDVDREVIGNGGYSPEDAIEQARLRVEGEDWEERDRKRREKLRPGKGGV